MEYRRKWENASEEQFQKYLAEHQDLAMNNVGHDDVIRSGARFPGHPQVRPSPFNDKSSYKEILKEHGDCVKKYAEVLPDITPGAITFCCTCPHPIILGFKVLERGEGPRAVLDVIASHFPEFPDFIIYDFACGVLRSAQHTLWWAIRNTIFVSDGFHVNNHTCHR